MQPTEREEVVLVDPEGRQIGVAEKLQAHRDGGQLHRAFSVYVFNGRDELLMQRRAADKYHFGGLWSNTCCGHPRPGEDVTTAGERRLAEEFGFTTSLRPILTFTYEADDEESGLTEREYLTVFVGTYEGAPDPDPNEIEAWRWCAFDRVRARLAEAPDEHTPWLRATLERWPNGDGGKSPPE